MNDRPLATTRLGTLQGGMEHGCAVFRGVPYAAPPTGALRFQPAQPAHGWAGVRDAAAHGPIAPQNPSDLRHFMGEIERPQSEDCLTLTIWTPAVDSKPRAVLLWLHGGAFVSGAGSLDWYNGARLALQGDVVVVHANYRLGAFGWLCWPGVAQGNMALSDQAMALQWVKDNITCFGGDPGCITLGGQSAGANCTARLMLDPVLRDSVRRVLLQSGGFGREPSTAEDGQVTGRVFLEALGIDPAGSDVGAKLRTAAVADILRAQALAEQVGFTLPVRQQAWRPVLDRSVTAAEVLDAIATALSGKDVLIGITRQEGHAFVGGPIPLGLSDLAVAEHFERATGGPATLAAYRTRLPDATPAQLLAELRSDQHFIDPALRLAELASARGADLRAYMFDWAPAGSVFGAGHCIDLAFAFGTWPEWAGSPMLAGGDTESMDAVSMTLRGSLAGFIADGPRGIPDGIAWPPYMPGRVLFSVAGAPASRASTNPALT